MPEIVLKDVVRTYGSVYAVDHLDLVIPDGSFFTLLGPSGCGKTTTLRMIAGLEKPTEGLITIGVPQYLTPPHGLLSLLASVMWDWFSKAMLYGPI